MMKRCTLTAMLLVHCLCCQAQQDAARYNQLETLPQYSAAGQQIDLELNRDAIPLHNTLGGAPDPFLEPWARIGMVVTPEGDTDHIVILDSSGSESYNSFLVDAAEAWKWQPALRDGLPVAQHLQLLLRVTRQHARGIAYFDKAYAAVSTAIDSGAMDEAWEELQDLLANNRQSIRESALLGWLHYRYLKASGDAQTLDLISSLQRAVLANESKYRAPLEVDPRTGTQHLEDSLRKSYGIASNLVPYLEPEDYVLALKELFTLRLQAQQYAGATDAWQRLRGIGANPAFRGQSEYISALLQELMPDYLAAQTALRDHTRTLHLSGKVATSGYWAERLSRSSFQVVAEAGMLEALELRCEAHFSRTPFNTESPVQTRQEAWGDCALYVQGAPDSTFSVTQH